MASNKELIKGTLDIADEAADNFDSKIPAIQRSLFNKILARTKDLKLDSNGRVKQTLENNRIILAVQKDIKDILESTNYTRAVQQFVKTYDRLADINNKWAKTVDKDAI